ncbi:centrosomal protein of 95 kDa [Latimeria chalumnae]|uniref:centrosomal protein of 95 kDa n=1 Tax=Latimeria chalumnae TaxID=7897 RepID=UPI0006D8DE69|nr:PREDICTED: centrosomal protein of 95 kDa [Latimeria chalumnae]|eukprot:XP_005993825.2 PREDICTED: centrosomal protein of 95 kDa [Latimeria chalumnae]
MGTLEEKDWLDVANELLTKCHINWKVKNLKECDASVFVSLYEAILGEKVPDYIGAPKSQENDAHNVQAVIDSLALDYLQVSLSHITGENIVKGDKESIQNLLEIFDGLLEYLTEQISEASSHNGCVRQMEPEPEDDCNVLDLKPSSSIGSTIQSDISIPSWDADGSESTAELIKLGDSAYTFGLKKDVPEFTRTGLLQPQDQMNSIQTDGQDGIEISTSKMKRTKQKESSEEDLPSREFLTDTVNISATRLGEPIRPAIPLQPPYQPTDYRVANQDVYVTTGEPVLGRHSPAHREKARSPSFKEVTELRTQPEPTSVTVSQSSLSSGGEQPVFQESEISARRAVSLRDASELSFSCAKKKVAFRTQPDIKLMTLQSELEQSDQWNSASEDEEDSFMRENSRILPLSDSYRAPRDDTLISHTRCERDLTASFRDEPLSRRRAKNKLAEQELHEMSKKLSQRIEELDQMLKNALAEKTCTIDSRDEDKLSQHSDSFMEYRRSKRKPGTRHTKRQPRARSLSSSPPPPRCSLQEQFEDALNKDTEEQMGSIRREAQHELNLQRMKAKMVRKAYEDELQSYEAKERKKLSKDETKAKEVEQEYKENIFKEVPKASQPSRVYSLKTTPWTPKRSQYVPSGGVVKPRKATPMKIKDNDLLPLLLEEFPYLKISPHTLNRMWKQQFRQIEHLTKSASEEERTRVKLQSEVEAAKKKHDFLVEIIKKEQEHNQRLREFKERIKQQKSAQNKMKEQRQQVARAKKYYNEYHVQLRAKMMRARTREERIFKTLFEEGLDIQKQRLRELRLYAKEKREEQKRRHKNELESMENYYKDQFSMLAEVLAQERQEIQVREKAQTKVLKKIKKDLHSKMEKEIQELQNMILKEDDDAFFQELEAERLKNRIQMASFQYSKSHLL